MKDIFEAIERLSAQLSFRLEHIAKKAGLAAHFSGYTVSPAQGILVRLFNTMIHLPKGYAVTIMPRAQPEAEADGASWHIDIRRNDGVSRASWSSGLTVRKLGDTFALTYDGRQFVGEDIQNMLRDLEKPGLSGMTLMIARLWIIMYGRMPKDLSTRLEAIRDVDLLDTIHDSLVNDAGADHVRSLITSGTGGEPAPAPTAAAPAAPIAAAAEPAVAEPAAAEPPVAEPVAAAPAAAEPTDG